MLSAVSAALVASSPDAILLFGANRRIQDVNPAASQLLGYTRDECLRFDIDLLAPAGTTWLAEARDVLDAGQTWCGQIEVERQDGTRGVADARAVRLAEAGEALTALFLRWLPERTLAAPIVTP